MSELLYSAIDPPKYLELAYELSQRSESSARRTAADRAYYAAFLTSRDCLMEKGYIQPYESWEDHEYISRELKSALGAVGNQENRLRRARNIITYNTEDLPLTKQNVRKLEWILETAAEIIKLVEQLPAKTKRSI